MFRSEPVGGRSCEVTVAAAQVDHAPDAALAVDLDEVDQVPERRRSLGVETSVLIRIPVGLHDLYCTCIVLEVKVARDAHGYVGAVATPETVAEPLIERVRVAVDGTSPLFVALDGRSGGGKSTVAAVVQAALGTDRERGEPLVTVIEGDQFYGGGSAATWDGRYRAGEGRTRHRLAPPTGVLRQLREHGRAEWQAFDWEAEDWDADVVPLRPTPVRASPRPSSCSRAPTAPARVRRPRGPARPPRPTSRACADDSSSPARVTSIGPTGKRGGPTAEDHYFGTIMPPDRFDLVLAEPSEQGPPTVRG